MSVPITTAAFDLWSRACVQALGAARNEIDALNVFPVPDSDTGTNVFLTFEAAASAVAGPVRDQAPLPVCVSAYVDGALLGARGNSGVIMAQLLRAMFGSLISVSDELRPHDVALALTRASDAAWAAVGSPVEGTILSVARAAAEAAVTAAGEGRDVEQTLSLLAAAARAALARTPSQLARLARSGVVDAGGRALVVVLDTTEHVLTGRWVAPSGTTSISPPVVAAPVVADDLDPDGPAYEVMYLLEAADEQIPTLRDTLAPLGDSLVVVGGDSLWNVHVHVDDVGAAVEAGIAVGRPYRIAVTHFADQEARSGGERRGGRTVVATAAGPGLAALYRQAGARVLELAVGDDLSVQTVLAAIAAAESGDVIVLPNSRDYVPVCHAAASRAREDGVRVSVVPTDTQVQGLSALAVHQPGRPFEDDVIAMTSAAGHTHHGAVTIAREAGMTMAGPCAAGDVLGVVDAEFAVVGSDLAQVAIDVVARLMTGSAELVTIVTGEGCDEQVAERIGVAVRHTSPYLDLAVYDGGQQRYPLLLAVE